MDKQNLKDYSDRELTLHVMNDEHLYRKAMRCTDEGDLDSFGIYLEDFFIFTDEQLEDLFEDLREGFETDDESEEDETAYQYRLVREGNLK